MNKQVSQVGVAALVLIISLIAGTTYWQTWANAGLADRQDNEIRLVAQFSIKRGKIYAADGRTLLATNVRKKVGGQTLYFRRYPTGPLFADVVGYSTQSRNRSGLERSYNDFLTGSNSKLDTGRFTPTSPFTDPGYCIEYGKQVRNAGNPEAPETFGSVNLETGFEHSINSVFCNIGKTLGAGTVLRYAERYGFYSLPPLETPENERVESGLYDRGVLFKPKHPETQVDPGRLAFGQERLQVTPLQMAMVAATVANRGVTMRPQLIERVVSPGGKTITRLRPR